jgi:pimeloyl-ACP methyl ester carboxylesterase
MAGHDVVMLPGGMLPADLAYGDLVDSLGDGVRAVAKDLEVYRADRPPPAYTLDVEIDGVTQQAAAAGLHRFHVVGYSAGGAAAVAFAARHPERVRSLALLEPAWLGNERLTDAERDDRRAAGRLAALPPDRMIGEFMRMQLAPGVEPPPPPPGEPPPWMAKRPLGLRALMTAFGGHRLDVDALHELHAPVYYALGALSNPNRYRRNAERAAELFDDFTLEVFEGRHHFDPPHRAEPDRVAGSLLALWRRAPA